MTTINGTTAATQSSSSSAISDATSSVMGKDDFLQLFLTSLQYQDPTAPMESKDMMAQMAILSLMEQVENMTLAVEDLTKVADVPVIQTGTDYLGKYVVGVSTDGTAISGKVDAVQLATDDSIVLKVGDSYIETQWITQISDTEEGLSL